MKKILKFFQNFSPKTKYVIAPLGSLLKWIFPFYDTWHDCCLFYQRRLGCQLDSNQRSWLETVSSHGPVESVTDIGWVGIPAGAVWSNRVSSSVSESRDGRGGYWTDGQNNGSVWLISDCVPTFPRRTRMKSFMWMTWFWFAFHADFHVTDQHVYNFAI